MDGSGDPVGDEAEFVRAGSKCIVRPRKDWKKRHRAEQPHEQRNQGTRDGQQRRLRLFSIDDHGIHIGEKLTEYVGLLGGRPTRDRESAARSGAEDD